MNDKFMAASIMHSSSVSVSTEPSQMKRPPQQQQPHPSSRSSHMYDRDGKRLTGLKGAAAQLLHDHRHFSSDEDLHRVKQSIASGQRAAAAAAFAPHTPRGPVLPDMFGVVPSSYSYSYSYSSSSATAAGAGAAGTGGSAVRRGGCVAPGLRWALVRCRRAAGKDVGLRWARADRLRVEDALAASVAPARGRHSEEPVGHVKREEEEGSGDKDGEKGEGDEGKAAEAFVLSAPPEETFSVFHGTPIASLTAFFTVSSEEYTTLGLDDDAFQPNIASSAVDGKESEDEKDVFRFDYTSTTKLLTLYERFGNFVVVADRWPYDICAPSPALHSPSVEALMERYRLVTEAVMMYRLRVLKDVLKDEHPDASGEAKPTIRPLHTASSNSKSASALPSHPLLSLMEKHPVLVARRCRIDYLRSRAKSYGASPSLCESINPVSGNSSGRTHGSVSNDDKDKQWEDHSVRLLAARRSALLESAAFPMDASPFWYDAPLESIRRKRLRAQLAEESMANVPYHCAVAALRRVEGQAAQLTTRLASLTAASALPRKSDARGRAADVEDNYAAVRAEVQRVPMMCERMRLCVQAGMFLQAPAAKSAGVAGSHGNHNNNNTNINSNNNNNTTASSNYNNTSGGGNVNIYGTKGSEVVNRAFSNTGEALLLSLPPAVPRLHRAVEQELEKHLWEDHRALCDDSPDVQQMLCDTRVLYTQNVILRRFATRVGALEAALKKLTTEAKTEEERGREY